VDWLPTLGRVRVGSDFGFPTKVRASVWIYFSFLTISLSTQHFFNNYVLSKTTMFCNVIRALAFYGQGNKSFTNFLNQNYDELMGSTNLNVQMYEPKVEIKTIVKK
jgi:hypothetical protein